MSIAFDESPTATDVASGFSERGIVLEGVGWATYERLLKGIGERYVFVTYDEGTLEIEISPGRKHEGGVDLLVGLMHSIRLLRGVKFEGGGSTTHKRSDLKKGIEAATCYWIANEEKMRGVADLDLSKHPAPDLVIEVDIWSSSLDRIAMFGTLGVPEIWHVEKGRVSILHLNEQGAYDAKPASLSFPFVTASALTKAVNPEATVGESAALDALLNDVGLR